MSNTSRVVTKIDHTQVDRYEHDEQYDAKRVVIVGGDFDTSGIVSAIEEKLSNLTIKVDAQPSVVQPQITEPQIIEKTVVVTEYKTIEVEKPIIITEYRMVEVEKPFVIDRVVYREVEKPVMVEYVKEIEKPIIVEKIPKMIWGIIIIQSLIILLSKYI
jgi:hypothetical protein